MRDYGFDLPDDVVCGDALRELEPALSSRVSAGFLVEQHWHVRVRTLTAGPPRRFEPVGRRSSRVPR